MFQFPGFSWASRDRRSLGSSPGHFAAFHAHILMTPRHPPRALRGLTTPTRARAVAARTRLEPSLAPRPAPSRLATLGRGRLRRPSVRASRDSRASVDLRIVVDCHALPLTAFESICDLLPRSSGDSVNRCHGHKAALILRDKAAVARHTIHKPPNCQRAASCGVRRIERLRGRGRGNSRASGPRPGGHAPRPRRTRRVDRALESGDLVES